MTFEWSERFGLLVWVVSLIGRKSGVYFQNLSYLQVIYTLGQDFDGKADANSRCRSIFRATARSALSLSTSSQQQSTLCPKHPMTLRFGVLTLPQHKMGPHCREHELGTQLGNDFSPIYSATWLSCQLSRLFSSLIFGASPTGVVWLTKGAKGSIFAYCT